MTIVSSRLNRPFTVFLATFAVMGGAVPVLAQLPSGSYREYEIRTVTNMTSPDPSEGTPAISRVYFGRSDGSRGVRTAEVIGGRLCTTTTSWNTMSREEVSASDCVLMKTTMPFSRVPFLARPLTTCAASIAEFKPVGVETIQGLRLERYEGDSKSAKSVTYVAPELGCLTLKEYHWWKNPSGEVTSTTFTEPIEVRLGTHEPALFDIPANLREVPPSERRDALNRYFTGRP